MLDQTSQVSKAKGLLIKARSMKCPFLVVAGHMWKIVLALAQHIAKAQYLLMYHMRWPAMRCLVLVMLAHACSLAKQAKLVCLVTNLEA
ncbi:hypothetical protein TIFTF001_035452 [Ficus carica]|uniref:Uncharacterized protein n=1 Tax=Ficus carica TaxID=3494 RepID=A0AA88J6H1_FICCA|nr:hypothetical protein TIFTF001_035452 [Ficus carica]